MTTKEDIKGIFRECLPAQLYGYIDSIVDQRNVLVREGSTVTLVPETDWTFISRRWHYFVGLCSAICVSDVGSVSYWTINAGERGYAATLVHASVYNKVKAIREKLVLMPDEPNSFRHPLNLPGEIYRIEDPAAAFVAADTYRHFL